MELKDSEGEEPERDDVSRLRWPLTITDTVGFTLAGIGCLSGLAYILQKALSGQGFEIYWSAFSGNATYSGTLTVFVILLLGLSGWFIRRFWKRFK